MGAIDYWIQASKRPSCLMAVSPYQGGAWLSPMRAGVAYPSEILRNFATEPATWYDLGLASSTIGMDDWELSGEIHINSLTAGKSIIYRSSDPRFGLYVTSSSQIIFINYSATGSNERIYYYDNPPTGEWLSFKMQRAGGWLRWFINDIEVKSWDKTGLYVEMNTAFPLSSNDDCNLRNCYFKNLTTGQIVWSYPSESERLRLLTYNNVRTDRGIFEAANTSLGWSIKTQLTGTVGTVIERRTTGIYVNSGKFNATTGIYTGLATDQLIYLLAFDYVLTAAEIAAFK